MEKKFKIIVYETENGKRPLEDFVAKLNNKMTADELFKERMKDPDFIKEYEALQNEFRLVDKILTEREKSNMTQAELAKKSGIPQCDISRIESGKGNPTLKTLRKIAQAFGKRLEVSFV